MGFIAWFTTMTEILMALNMVVGLMNGFTGISWSDLNPSLTGTVQLSWMGYFRFTEVHELVCTWQPLLSTACQSVPEWSDLILHIGMIMILGSFTRWCVGEGGTVPPCVGRSCVFLFLNIQRSLTNNMGLLHFERKRKLNKRHSPYTPYSWIGNIWKLRTYLTTNVQICLDKSKCLNWKQKCKVIETISVYHTVYWVLSLLSECTDLCSHCMTRALNLCIYIYIYGIWGHHTEYNSICPPSLVKTKEKTYFAVTEANPKSPWPPLISTGRVCWAIWCWFHFFLPNKVTQWKLQTNYNTISVLNRTWIGSTKPLWTWFSNGLVAIYLPVTFSQPSRLKPSSVTFQPQLPATHDAKNPSWAPYSMFTAVVIALECGP